jgi:indole-3-glycerol phosphate synthase
MTTLEQIVAAVRSRVDVARKEEPIAKVAELARKRNCRGFRRALETRAKTGPAIIAELKQKSPSKGMLRGTFPVGMLAYQMAQGGAAALSVLTEEDFFAGSLQNLREAAAATELPCLRKDFIVDEYQVHEAKANGADAILLIAAALDDAKLRDLHAAAKAITLDVLCEVHDEAELARVLAVGAEIIGVNCRDLKTLAVHPETHDRLASALPPNVIKVAESGIVNGADIKRLRSRGYHGFLIGETLMRSDNITAELQKLLKDSQ